MPAVKEPATSVALADDPSIEARRARLAATEISLIVLLVACVAVAIAFPFWWVKYAIIAVFAVALLAQCNRRPAMGLAMLAFATPVVDLVPPSLFGIRGLNAETIVLVVAIFIWARASNLYGRDGFSPPLGRILAVYAVVILASSINSWLIWKTSLFDIVSSAKNHLTYIVFFPVAFHVLRERRDQWLLVGAASLALVLNCAQAIHASLPAFLAGNLERHRAVALLAIQPNTFGAALAMYLPLLVVFALNKGSNRAAQLWFLVCSGAAAFTLILTLSRGAWIGAAVGLALVALFDRKLLVVLLIAAPFYEIWVPQQAIDRVEVTAETEGQDMAGDEQLAENSTQMRIEQYKSLAPMMAPRPVFGWGYKSFPQVFEKYGTLQRAKGAHSSYCQIGTEEGTIGLIVLAAILLGMCWAGFQGARVTTDPLHRWLGVAVLGGTVAMAFCMISGARFEPQKIFTFFWIIAGIVQRESVLAVSARAAAGSSAAKIGVVDAATPAKVSP